MPRASVAGGILVLLCCGPLVAQAELAGTWTGTAGGVAVSLTLGADGRYSFTLALPQGPQTIRGRYQADAGNLLFLPDAAPGQAARYLLRRPDADTLALTDMLGQGSLLRRQAGAPRAVPVVLQPAGSFAPRLPLPAADGGHIVFTRQVPLRLGPVEAALPKLFVVDADGGHEQPFLAPGDATSVSQARWSARGDRLAFVSDYRLAASACMQDIFVVGADGQGLRRVTGNEQRTPPTGWGQIVGRIVDNTGADEFTPSGTVRPPSTINITAQGLNGAIVHPGEASEGDLFKPETGQKVGTYRGYRFRLPRVPAGKIWVKTWFGRYDGNFTLVDVQPGQVADIGDLKLVDHTLLISQPSLTPDGRYVACISSLASVNRRAKSFPLGADGGGGTANLPAIGGVDSLTLVDLATGLPAALLDPLKVGGQNATAPAVSPDGQLLAAAHGMVTRENLVTFGLGDLLANRPQARVLVPSRYNVWEVPPRAEGAGTPAWSPDGRLLAFSRSSTTTAARADLCVVGVDGTGARQVTRLGPHQLACQPCFSPDGRRLAFTVLTADAGLLDIALLLGGKGFTSDLYAVNLDGTDLRRLTHDGRSSEPAWGR